MTTRKELLSKFEQKLSAEGGGLYSAEGRNEQHVTCADMRSAVTEINYGPDPEGSGDVFKVETHICYFFDGSEWRGKNQTFYVVNPGTADERAGWIKNDDPKPDDTTWKSQSYAWLKSKIGKTVRGYTFRSIKAFFADEDIEVSFADVGLEDHNGDLVTRDIQVWRDGQGGFAWKVVKSA